MPKHVIILAAISMALTACTNGPELNNNIRPDISTLRDFTACDDAKCITPIAKAAGRCFANSEARKWGQYHRFEVCNGSHEADDIVIDFGDRGAELSASITTSHQAYAETLFSQVKQLGYVQDDTDVEVDGDRTRWWFDASDQPDSRLMWETFEEDGDHTRWHIGIVWEVPA